MAPPIICGRDRPPVQLRPPGGCPGALGSDLHPPGLAGSPGGHRRRQEPGPRPGRRGWTMGSVLWPGLAVRLPFPPFPCGWVGFSGPGHDLLTRRTCPPGLPAWCGPPAFCLCRPRGMGARSLRCSQGRLVPVSGSTPTPRRAAGGRCTRVLGHVPGPARLFRGGSGPLGGGLLWVRAGPGPPSVEASLSCRLSADPVPPPSRIFSGARALPPRVGAVPSGGHGRGSLGLRGRRFRLAGA